MSFFFFKTVMDYLIVINIDDLSTILELGTLIFEKIPSIFYMVYTYTSTYCFYCLN